MAFPGGQNPRVDLYYDAQWNNITADVLSRDAENSIVIRRGQESEGSEITPSSCSLSLKNPTGTYSPRNPNSSLYGKIGRNTPLRVGIGVPPIAKGASSATNSTTITAPSITAEATGLQIIAAAAYTVGNFTTPAGFTASSELDATFITFNTFRKASVGAGSTGSTAITYSTTATGQAAINMHLPGGTFVSDQTFSGVSGNFSTGTYTSLGAGEFVVLVAVQSADVGDDISVPTIYAADTGQGPFLMADSGVSADASVPRIQAWGWWAPGAAASYQIEMDGMADTLGDTILRVIRVSGVTNYNPRFNGKISEFPVEWDKKGGDVYTPIVAQGLTRQLTAPGANTVVSSLTNHFSRAANILAYWPMEDGFKAETFGSGLSSGSPMTLSSTRPIPAAFDGFAGSKPVPTFNAAGAIGEVANYTLGQYVSAAMMVTMPAGTTAAGANLFSLYFGVAGTIQNVILEYTSATTFTVRVLADGGVSGTQAYSLPAGTTWSSYFNFIVQVEQSGGDVRTAVFLTDFSDNVRALQYDYSGTPVTLTTQTMGKVVRVQVATEDGGATIHNTAVAFGQFILANGNANAILNNPNFGPASALLWQAQRHHFLSAMSRFLVQGFTSGQTYTSPSTSVPNGYSQPLATPVQILNTIARTDFGSLIFEPVGFYGYRFRTMNTMYNQAPRLTLSYTASQLTDPLVTLDDDQLVSNDVTMEKPTGASARATLTTGPVGSTAVGRYQQTHDVIPLLDSTLLDLAAWAVAMGTVDEGRWPAVTVHFGSAGNSGIISTMKYMDIGDVIRLTNLPSWVPPGPVDLVTVGYEERLGFTDWMITFNTIPATGYDVLQVETADYDRVADDGRSTLTSDITTTATSISVTTAAGFATFTNAAADLPYQIRIGGEWMSVTAVGGATSPQTLTVTRSVNGIVKAHLAGALVEIYPYGVVALN